MKNTLFILLVALICFQSAAQEKYSRVKILTGKEGLHKISALGIETDHGLIRPNVWFIAELSQREIDKVKTTGLPYEIMVDDVKEDFLRRNREPQSAHKLSGAGYPCGNGMPQYTTPANFSLGSMGGHLYYYELLDHLDEMYNQFPNLITVKAPVDASITTIEGRPVFYVKISDNPTVNEPEPQMLYTAIHHAREPVSMHQLIFYMWYLLENYSSNPLVQQIVNSTELYFIPCINPDGYIENEITDPTGGGMWRKNKRNNLDGTFGVDLNRNYGYNWGYDNNGSSPLGVDETYRGTGPFSEPETEMVKNFVNAHNFKIALNYHTFGNLLIYPWGYIQNLYTPDSALFVNYGSMLTEQNRYTFGTANQTVGYVVNGSSDDWMYGEQTIKPKILAMTPEVGPWFWPSQFEIEDLCHGTVYQNLLAAQLCGPYADVRETGEKIISSVSGHIKFSLQQLGLDTTATYTVTLAPASSNIVSTGSPKLYSNLSLLQTLVDSIAFTLVNTNLNYGDELKFVLSINNGLYTLADTVIKIFGVPTQVYFSSFPTSGGWTPQSGWGITSQQYYSAPTSITDSPNGNYPSNTVRTFTSNNQFNLINAVSAELTYFAKWAIEPNFDFAQVLISTDNGGTWTPLCGNFTVEGTLDQDPGQPVYEGFQNTWVKERIDLTPYIGNQIKIRFMLVSDGFEEYDGFYFDDLSIVEILPGGLSVNENLTGNFSVHIYPNPALHQITFSTTLKNESELTIADASGRLIQNQKMKSGISQCQINLTQFESGIYFYTLKAEDGTAIRGKFSVLK